MKRLDQVTLAENGLDVELGTDHIVRLVHVLDPTPFRRERKQHGHQTVMVSKALPLWRQSICHRKIFNTRQATNKICHGSSVYVRVGGEQHGVCIIDSM